MDIGGCSCACFFFFLRGGVTETQKVTHHIKTFLFFKETFKGFPKQGDTYSDNSEGDHNFSTKPLVRLAKRLEKKNKPYVFFF